MKNHQLVLFLSVITALSAFFTVIYVLKNVVVPHLRLQAHLGTVCSVRGVRRVTYSAPCLSSRRQNLHLTAPEQVFVSRTNENDLDNSGFNQSARGSLATTELVLASGVMGYNESDVSFAKRRASVKVSMSSENLTTTPSVTLNTKNVTVDVNNATLNVSSFDIMNTLNTPLNTNNVTFNMSSLTLNTTHVIANTSSGQCTRDCVRVDVIFTGENGRDDIGYLRPKAKEIEDMFFSTHSQCFCHNCSISVDAATGRQRVTSHDGGGAGREIVVGQTTACYLKTTQALRTASKLTSSSLAALHPSAPGAETSAVMHAIAWPTAVFVVGFVATFFSLIYVCRDWDMDFSDMDFCIYVTGMVDGVV